VYYGKTAPLSMSTAPVVDVPNISGTDTPTSVPIAGLSAGTWYFMVLGYSHLIYPGITVSHLSTTIQITLP